MRLFNLVSTADAVNTAIYGSYDIVLINRLWFNLVLSIYWLPRVNRGTIVVGRVS